jgi:putative aminopeptidase FrvX
MERNENELIKIIKAWYPLFEVEKEAYMMLPDELVFDVKELARKHNVKIQILKMRRRTNYTFVAWIPRGANDDEEDDEEDIEIVEKEDYDTIKQMIYDFVKEKKQCRVDDIKKFFSTKGISVGEDKIREILRQLHAEKKVKYSTKGVSLK